MRLALAFLLLAGSLSAQARSDVRLKVTKVAHRDTVWRTDTVTVTRRDTVFVHDTVSVFKAALPPAPPDSVKCNDRYIPIPIPIPFPRGHGSSGGSNTGGPVTATPEPETIALFATGLVGLAAFLKWRR